MSQAEVQQAAGGESAPKVKKIDNLFAPCAVLVGENDAIFACGSKLRAGSEIESVVNIRRQPNRPSWLGFSLEFRISEDAASVNEQSGFGVRHDCKYLRGGSAACFIRDVRQLTTPSGDMALNNGQVTPCKKVSLRVKFPREHTEVSMETPSPQLLSQFPDQKALFLFKVELKNGARVTVDGFGVPFADPANPGTEAILNDNAAVVDNIGLLELLSQDCFRLVMPAKNKKLPSLFSMKRLPEPFSYPYGAVEEFAEEKYSALLAEHKGPAFIRSTQ